MASNLRILRRKRRIVGEIRQITRAMKLVSAAKLKRTIATRAKVQHYFSELSEAVGLVAAAAGPEVANPWAEQREVETVGLVVVAGDKGLCGAYNSSIIGRALEFAEAQRARVVTLTVGTKAAEMLKRTDLVIAEEFPALVDKLHGRDAAQMTDHLLDLYRGGEVDKIDVCYGEFISSMVQRPALTTLLPVTFDQADMAATAAADRYLFEPEPAQLLVNLMPRYLRAQVHNRLLESAAAEHSARLTAMSAATDNAEEMLEVLTRQINRARQAEVTRELLDVVSGADALQSQS